MPRETRNYVPKLLAMKEIVNNPSKYGIQIPIIPTTPYFKSFLINNSLDVKLISKLAEIETDEFLALNANSSPSSKQKIYKRYFTSVRKI